MTQPAKVNNLESILEAALRVFGRHGYEGASINEVASEAGVTKPTVYNHFQNKAKLYEEMLRFGHRRMMESLEAAVARFRSPGERIQAALRVQFRLARKYADLVKVIHTIMFLPDDIKPRVDHSMFIEEKFGFMQRLVQEGVDAGELEGDPVDIALALSSVSMLCAAQASLPAFPLLESGLEERLWNVVYQGAKKR